MKTDAELRKRPRRLSQLRIGIVTAMFHRSAGRALERACRQRLEAAGVPPSQIVSVTAPGSYELPLLAQRAIRVLQLDAVILLGAIVKGETYHFEVIANEVGRAAMNVMLKTNVPVILEVIPAYTPEQVVTRTRGPSNKGTEAAEAALHVLASLEALEEHR